MGSDCDSFRNILDHRGIIYNYFYDDKKHNRIILIEAGFTNFYVEILFDEYGKLLSLKALEG